MKKRLQGFAAGALAVMVLGCVPTVAKDTYETIQVKYDNIKIYVDGEEVNTKDANGNTVEPFIYNGTTYLPVRAVGNAIGKEVSWDGVEKVVYLGAKPGNVENWLDVCGPYQYLRGEEYRLTENKYFTMSGKKYTNGFVLAPFGYATGSQRANALFNLDGKFEKVSFRMGHIDGTKNDDAELNIYIDGIIEYTADLDAEDVAKKITIPLNGALQMKIEIVGSDYTNSGDWGFSEGEFE